MLAEVVTYQRQAWVGFATSATLAGLLPEGIDLLDGNPGAGVLEDNAVEPRGLEDLPRVEAKASACIEQGPAGHAED